MSYGWFVYYDEDWRALFGSCECQVYWRKKKLLIYLGIAREIRLRTKLISAATWIKGFSSIIDSFIVQFSVDLQRMLHAKLLFTYEYCFSYFWVWMDFFLNKIVNAFHLKESHDKMSAHKNICDQLCCRFTDDNSVLILIHT